MNYLKVLLVLFLLGCDVPAKIIITNKNDKAATFRYSLKENPDSLKYQDVLLDNKNRSATMLFGFGQLWNDKRIREYSASLNYISTISDVDTVTFNNEDSIFNFLRSRRNGLLKDKIRIVIH